MPTFTTDIKITTKRSALELMGIAADVEKDEDDLEVQATEEVTVEVDYEYGWFEPGRFSGSPEDCYPDEGESPEILNVWVTDEDENRENILEDLTKEQVKDLIEAAWEDQNVDKRDYWDDAYNDWNEDPWGEIEAGFASVADDL